MMLKQRYDERSRQRARPDIPALRQRMDEIHGEVDAMTTKTTEMEQLYQRVARYEEREKAEQEMVRRRYWKRYRRMNLCAKVLVTLHGVAAVIQIIVVLMGQHIDLLIPLLNVAGFISVMLLMKAEQRIEAATWQQ